MALILYILWYKFISIFVPFCPLNMCYSIQTITYASQEVFCSKTTILVYLSIYLNLVGSIISFANILLSCLNHIQPIEAGY